MGRNHIHFAAGKPGENGVISGKFVLHVFFLKYFTARVAQ
jgi:hypothetical protein